MKDKRRPEDKEMDDHSEVYVQKVVEERANKRTRREPDFGL